MSAYLDARSTTPEWVAGELVLWGDDRVTVTGTASDIRNLLARCASVIPTTPTDTESEKDR